MNKPTLFFISILIVLLASCVSAPPANPDLYSSVQSSRATSDAALQQAYYQSQFLTATAEAPVIQITQTAAALVVQQQGWTVTAQWEGTQRAIPVTQTAMAWTPTVDATQTAVYARSIAEATQIANNTQRDILELERQQTANQFWAILPGVTYAVVVGLLIIAFIWVIKNQRYRPMTVDGRGNPIPLLDILDGTFTDPDRSPNYHGPLSEDLFREWLREKLKLPPQLPAITAERQDATTQRDQLIDLATRGLPGEQKTERKRLAGQEMMKQISGPTLESRFKILDGQTSNLEAIDGVVIDELDTAWKAEKK